MKIKKADGTFETFEKKRLIGSLTRSGATRAMAEQIANHVEKEIHSGDTTTRIYRHAFNLLRKQEDRSVSLRYSLRRALTGFGPSGFPFERFVADIYKHLGYKARTGVPIKGSCISHEMDVVAKREDEVVTAELKFHNNTKTKSDLKVVLYMTARFDDIAKNGYYEGKHAHRCIITNTKFTANAIKFADCAGIELIGWNYPKGRNLHDIISEVGLHPLTALTTISKAQKKWFLQNGYASCKELGYDNGKILRQNPLIPKDKIEKILDEIVEVCECVTCRVPA